MLVARAAEAVEGGLSIQYRDVNGEPSAVVFAKNSPYAVMVVDLSTDGEHVRDIYVVSNPDKLSHVPEETETPHA
ncbi:hypothetical protein FAF44_53105 [Nonomuraea sp. MG754425]|nr:hypothetical protein [Nonomuraea sp. MG754425]